MLAAQGDDTPIIELHEHPGAKSTPVRSRLGLFHFAILLPDRSSLGRFVKHLGAIGARAGASDHLVSEAFYLQDPDNLGIEVYADRPRSSWLRVGRELMMGTDSIDITSLVGAADGPWTGMPPGTTIGHVHLHVGDIATASAFYSEAMGFDRTVWHYPGALFLSAGGYHHHLGTNTWAGPAPSPAPDEAQLLGWTVQLPERSRPHCVPYPCRSRNAAGGVGPRNPGSLGDPSPVHDRAGSMSGRRRSGRRNHRPNSSHGVVRAGHGNDVTLLRRVSHRAATPRVRRRAAAPAPWPP